MRIYLILCILLLPQAVLAQQFTLTGRLVDPAGEPLPEVTVLLLNTSDSTLQRFGATGEDGRFEIRSLRHTGYLLKIALLGYETYTRRIAPPGSEKLLDLGALKMEPDVQAIGEVVVEEERLPVQIRKDTIEFNAAAFKTRQHAKVEDLLKKLPGVEVDQDGNIKAQGEDVKRITVEGKDFFGKDPKIASRNLPADAVDKLQVFDRQSDEAAFTGIDDGEREKTINLDLKDTYKGSAFGTLTAGGGSDERFRLNGNINRFRQKEQLSFLGMGNNTNEQGFSIGDYLNFTGGPQQMQGGPGLTIRFGGPGNAGSGRGGTGGSSAQAGQPLAGAPVNAGQSADGLMTNWAGGVNMNRNFGKKLELNASYFLNYLDHNIDQSLDRASYLPDNNYHFRQNSSQQNNNINHRLNTVLDYKPDSANAVRLNTSFSYNQTDMNTGSESQTFSNDGTAGSISKQANLADGSNLNFNTDLLYRHRFGKRGRNFSANFKLGIGDNDRNGHQSSETGYPGEQRPAETIYQDNVQSNGNRRYSAGLSYTEPLGGIKYLEANYHFQQQRDEVTRDVWDLENEMRLYNDELSNRYNSSYSYHREGLNFRLAGEGYNLTAGLSLQQSRLNGELLLQDTAITRHYESILPFLRFGYDFTGSRHLEFTYRTQLQEPSIEQLQPVVDNSDPLNVYMGNPELLPAYMHLAQLNYMSFDPYSLIHLFGVARVSYTRDAITMSQTVDEQLARTTQPVNAGDQWTYSGHASFGLPLSRLNSRLNLMTSLSRQQGISLLNGTETGTRTDLISGTLRYDYHYGELLDVFLSGNISRQLNAYDAGQEDQLFYNQRYSAETTLNFPENYSLGLDFSYLLYNSRQDDFSQDIPMLDAFISRYVFKNKSGEIKLSVENLLDKDLGVSQQADANYIERSVTRSLGRYFLLSFTYALNKQLNPMNEKRGRGPKIIQHN